MKRNLQQLAAREYDLLIVGGGIYGAWAAWDAALRGLSVALVEQHDFGGATSSNSLKIIHGGLRYLQHADFKRMRESIHERTVLMHVAPHLVHPLPCLMPTYGHGLKGREVMYIAMKMNDLVGFDRNRLADPQKFMPDGKIISRDEVLQHLPGIDESNLTGGAVWYDCQVHNSERLLLSLLQGAVARGAAVANYAPVTGFLRDGKRIFGAQVLDRESGQTHRVRARVVVNTSGPWINKLLKLAQPLPSTGSFYFSRAMNLVVNRRLIERYAAGIPSKYEFKDADAVLNKGSRLLFFTPWRHYTLIGTTHWPYSGDPDNFSITEQDVRTFLDEFNQAYPARAVRREEISHVYGGLLPADGPGEGYGHVNITKHYRLIDHSVQDKVDGLVSVLGVKYTTARDVAVKAIDLAARKLAARPARTQTDTARIYGAEIDDFDHYLRDEAAKRPRNLTPEVIRHLIYNYGTRYAPVLELMDQSQDLRERLSPQEEVLAAEVVQAVRAEMAVHVADVVRRRTELGSARCPTDAELRRCAELMAGELGWDGEQIAAEIAETRALYRIGVVPGAGARVAADATLT